MFVNSSKLISLSEQQIVSCDKVGTGCWAQVLGSGVEVQPQGMLLPRSPLIPFTVERQRRLQRWRADHGHAVARQGLGRVLRGGLPLQGTLMVASRWQRQLAAYKMPPSRATKSHLLTPPFPSVWRRQE